MQWFAIKLKEIIFGLILEKNSKDCSPHPQRSLEAILSLHAVAILWKKNKGYMYNIHWFSTKLEKPHFERILGTFWPKSYKSSIH